MREAEGKKVSYESEIVGEGALKCVVDVPNRCSRCLPNQDHVELPTQYLPREFYDAAGPGRPGPD